ncbi:MAG: (deoxy)nucleoside triphosphate pyrophosphohydrolase [Bdellovibrionales bacterium]
MKLPFLFVTAIALMDADRRVLLAQRPEGKSMAGLWEFPGGKVDSGETPEDALVREIKEELNVDIRAEDLLPLTFASHAYEAFHLFMPLFLCRTWRGDLCPMEGQKIEWVFPADFNGYAMPAADVPLAAFLRKFCL